MVRSYALYIVLHGPGRKIGGGLIVGAASLRSYCQLTLGFNMRQHKNYSIEIAADLLNLHRL